MTEDERKQAAALLETKIFVDVLNQLEADAIDRCLAVPPQDDAGRAAWAAEARAIRNLRSRLKAIATMPPRTKSAPA